MLSVCAGSDPRIDSVMEHLLTELAEGKEDKMQLIRRCGLDEPLWQQLQRHYGYHSEEPGLRDFVIELFKSCYAMGTDGTFTLNADALVFLKRWKDSRKFAASFEQLSAECAEVLGTEQDLLERDFRDLIELDYFELIDKKIISDLVREIIARTVSNGDVAQWVRQRRQSHWYATYRHLYEAVEYAARFISTLGRAALTMDSLQDGVTRYSQSWFRLDQYYRKFFYHVRSSGMATLTNDLADDIENLYSNTYLLKLNDQWQEHVDQAKKWDAGAVQKQQRLFDQSVKPFLAKDNKLCVIISDAMRYEIADELLSRIQQEDRYNGELEPALSSLPSFTQLGMAALLPNKQLRISEKDGNTVMVDDQPSTGLINRHKILKESLGDEATAHKAGDFMQMNREECRTLIRDHEVVYIYHDHIDSVGHNRDSEERVFEAVEQTIEELVRLVKKLNNANAYNMILTADHGFIYQNRPIDESDFSSVEVQGDDILYRDRRFVVGRGLKKTTGARIFKAEELGLAGDLEVLIPKSINRLRQRGSGSRFVHGGASLQEVVVPVLHVNKKRQSDISAVNVDIIKGTTSIITSAQLAVTLYQSEAVTDKVRPRYLRAGIYTKDGELISDQHDLDFDLTSENPRDRELKIRLLLTRKADKLDSKDVVLKLEEKHAGTSHYKEYKSTWYTIRRTFTTDFDL